MIDMSGIGITRKKPKPNTAPRTCVICHTPEGLPHRYRHIPKYAEVV
jgi:cytochrome c553